MDVESRYPMDISFNSSVSGMRAAIKRHDITAHDVANINTPGFEERIPHQVETQPDGTEISHISRRPNPQKDLSNTDLAEETKEQIQNKRSLQANAKALKAKDKMLGEIIDLVG
jgi:flagellar hook protein FlgE